MAPQTRHNDKSKTTEKEKTKKLSFPKKTNVQGVNSPVNYQDNPLEEFIKRQVQEQLNLQKSVSNSKQSDTTDNTTLQTDETESDMHIEIKAEEEKIVKLQEEIISKKMQAAELGSTIKKMEFSLRQSQNRVEAKKNEMHYKQIFKDSSSQAKGFAQKLLQGIFYFLSY